MFLFIVSRRSANFRIPERHEISLSRIINKPMPKSPADQLRFRMDLTRKIREMEMQTRKEVKELRKRDAPSTKRVRKVLNLTEMAKVGLASDMALDSFGLTSSDVKSEVREIMRNFANDGIKTISANPNWFNDLGNLRQRYTKILEDKLGRRINAETFLNAHEGYLEAIRDFHEYLNRDKKARL